MDVFVRNCFVLIALPVIVFRIDQQPKVVHVVMVKYVAEIKTISLDLLIAIFLLIVDMPQWKVFG